MKILRTVDEATAFMNSQEKPIGFVPTMGALHEGHLTLLKQAKQENAIAGVSIFVNPLQFNNPTDFANYPIDTSNDVAMLESVGADFLFLPNKDELLKSHQVENYDLGEVDSVMEGAFRPGHFQGVANIVDLLFSVIKPQNAYFGEKDFQQLAVIRKLVELKNIPVKIIGCTTIREANGLALSSRNRRLDSETKEMAAEISRFICSLDKKYPNQTLTETIRADVYSLLGKFNFRADYFEICDHENLRLQEKFDRSVFVNACIAYYAGEVRLIDNCPYPPSEK